MAGACVREGRRLEIPKEGAPHARKKEAPMKNEFHCRFETVVGVSPALEDANTIVLGPRTSVWDEFQNVCFGWVLR